MYCTFHVSHSSYCYPSDSPNSNETDFFSVIIFLSNTISTIFNKAMNQLVDKKTFSISNFPRHYSLLSSPPPFPLRPKCSTYSFFVCSNFSSVHFYFLLKLFLLLFFLRPPFRRVSTGEFLFHDSLDAHCRRGDRAERSD